MGSGNRRSPATGRKMREAVNQPGKLGRKGPERRNGSIVPKGRLAFRRDQNTRGR